MSTWNASDTVDFRKLARDAGMLPARIYKRYYETARYRSRGSIIELGTGQGAGTIAFALGIKHSGRSGKVIAIDQFQQRVRGPHPASVKTHGDAAVAVNVAAFRANLREYGVEEFVELVVARTDEANVDATGCDMLVIDVDGMIDRDLALFYDSLPEGSIIVIDDCRNMINSNGWANLEKYQRCAPDQLQTVLDHKTSFERRTLLGKHLLTYRLVQLFRALGLIRQVRVRGGTMFCRKKGSRSFSSVVQPQEIMAIEEHIVDEFHNYACNPRQPWLRFRWLMSRVRNGIARRLRRYLGK